MISTAALILLQLVVHGNIPASKTKTFLRNFEYIGTNKKSEMKELQCHSNGKLSFLEV